MTLLGFDYGRRYIGVAIGSTDTGFAEPLTMIDASTQPTLSISSLISQHHPERLVVGISERTSAQEAEGFATTLRSQFHLPVELVDETFSSQEATQKLVHTPTSKRHLRAHAAAATIILSNWLDRYNLTRV